MGFVPYSPRALRRPLLIVFATLGLGCVNVPANPAPRTRMHFPTGMAVDHPYGSDGGVAHTLYVDAFSNFDLLYDTGLVYAFNLDAMNPFGTGLIPPDGGAMLQLADLGDAGYWNPDSGVVEVDSMGGELRLVQTSMGGLRVFLASRFSNVVTAIDVPSPDELICFGGGTDCTNETAAPPLDIEIPQTNGNQIIDVFGLSNPIETSQGERDLFITHLRDLAYGSGGITGGTYGNNTSQVGEDFLIRQNIDDPDCRMADAIGSTGASNSVAFDANGLIYVLATGRYGGSDNAIRTLTVPDTVPCQTQDAGMTPLDPNTTPDIGAIDLTQIVKGNDGRAMGIGSKGDRIYALTRSPDALVVLRLDGLFSWGPSLHVSNVAPVLPGPAELLVLPRTDTAGNPIGDLVVVACADADSLAFYDDDLGSVVAAIPGVGDLPFAMVATERTLGVGANPQVLPGARIFTTAFGSGQISVVDVPDLLNPQTAQLVAMIGTFEDTSASPINPTNTVFTGSVSGPAGIP